MVVVEPAPESQPSMTPESSEATACDLVVLSFLTDRPSHGYALNQELQRCEVEDWAALSRPQVYYSLRKGERLGWLSGQAESGGEGPARQVYAVTEAGKRVLVEALSFRHWARKRIPTPFITWLALAHQLPRSARRSMVQERRQFLSQEIAKEEVSLREILKASQGEPCPASLMVELCLQQFRQERQWLDQVESVLQRLQEPAP
ncbi:MAG: PadR family transcriptional regulator [Planctomycetota bacterium]|nr:MAG: PadR family transcriptional regulator [Planctomycetota bacterium]